MLDNNSKIYTIEELHSLLVPICRKYGVYSVGVVGSYAKDTAKITSDIDLLIDFGDVNNFEKYCNFEDAIKLTLNNKEVDLIDVKYAEPEFSEELKSTEVRIYDHEQ